MSDTSAGDGWWEASDSKWYPPEDHPDFVDPRPSPPVITTRQPQSQPPGRGDLSPGKAIRPERHASRWALLIGAVTVVALAGGVGWALLDSSDAAATADASSTTAPTTTTTKAPAAAPLTDDRATKSNLSNALTAGKVIYADEGDYSGVNPGTLSSVEPSLVFAAGDRASNGAAVVSVDVRDSGLVMTLSALSDSGVCFYVQDDLSASTSVRERGWRPFDVRSGQHFRPHIHRQLVGLFHVTDRATLGELVDGRALRGTHSSLALARARTGRLPQRRHRD